MGAGDADEQRILFATLIECPTSIPSLISKIDIPEFMVHSGVPIEINSKTEEL